MSFVAEVIYGLKMEYGQPVTLSRDVVSINMSTGAKTVTTPLSVSLNNVILLPLNMRQAFYKSLNLQSEIYLQPGEQQFVIDACDVPWVPAVNDYLTDQDSARLDINRVETIQDDAYLVTARLLV